MAAITLGRWCSPEVILIVATEADEPALMLHAVRQAKRSAARILLVYATPAASRRSSAAEGQDLLPPKTLKTSAQTLVERTMTQILWKRVWSESVPIKNLRVEDIPAFVRSNAVDRVIVASGSGGPMLRPKSKSVAEELMATLDVPICVVGRHVHADLYDEQPSRRILLAVSLQSDCEDQLRFACRFAHQHGASLTVLHVFDRWEAKEELAQRNPLVVGSRLPLSLLNEAGFFCPLEISVREGDPAHEIVNFDARAHHDFIILGSPSAATVPHLLGRGVVRTVLSEARCPIIIIKPSFTLAAKPAAKVLTFGHVDSLSKRAS
jgi:nucleotide-binding universal stress UspA family protein